MPTIRRYSSLRSTTRGAPEQRKPCRLKLPPESGILQVTSCPSFARRWKTNMLKAESVRRYVEQLSALPPRERLEVYRTIQDPELRRQVVEGLPPKLHAEMLGESAVESLNRNVLQEIARRKGHKPDRAA